MELQLILIIILHLEILLMLFLFVYIIMLIKKPSDNKDPLLRHLKEYLSEGYTMAQAREKMKKLGFDDKRIDKITTDFLKD